MKEKFEDWNPGAEKLRLLDISAEIIDEYALEGFDLSVRQLYYQLVSRDEISNDKTSYDRIKDMLTRGRNAGLIDWDMIVDRTRQVSRNSHWRNESSIIKAAAESFAIDKWGSQPYRILVMVEKDALSGVLRPVCEELDIEFSANKGYASSSHLYRVAKTMKEWTEAEDESDKQIPLVLYFGDHDPSGLDMDRDLRKRLSMYSGLEFVEVSRMALTYSQIEEHQPPPNPTKITDSRAEGYIIEFGNSSWELDAMEPRLLADLVRTEVALYRDDYLWNIEKQVEENMRFRLEELAENFSRG